MRTARALQSTEPTMAARKTCHQSRPIEIRLAPASGRRRSCQSAVGQAEQGRRPYALYVVGELRGKYRLQVSPGFRNQGSVAAPSGTYKEIENWNRKYDIPTQCL